MEKSLDRLKLAYGNWVVGDRFWGREDDLALFIEQIDEGAHLLVTAQRRMGKTSLMREAARRLAPRYICLFVDLQGESTPADAIAKLSLATAPHARLWRKVRGLFANVLGAVDELKLSEVGIKLRGGLSGGNWTRKGDQLFATLAAADRPVVLLLDEVPILIHRMLKGPDSVATPERRALTDAFLSWLRETRIRYQGRIRTVISGSIGLEPILGQAGLSATLSTLTPFELKPWTAEVAMGCLDALANEYGIQFETGATQAIVDRLGCCVPHHVQVFFSHVRNRCRRRRESEFPRSAVDDVYQSELLGVRGHLELAHYEERLKAVLTPETLPLALEMLTEAAVVGRLTAEALERLRRDSELPDSEAAESQRQTLHILEHDGYLRTGRDGYVFVSKLVRDWWRKQHRLYYTPVLERAE